MKIEKFQKDEIEYPRKEKVGGIATIENQLEEPKFQKLNELIDELLNKYDGGLIQEEPTRIEPKMEGYKGIIEEKIKKIRPLLEEKKRTGRKFEFRNIISQADIRCGGRDWTQLKNEALKMGFEEIKNKPCILRFSKDKPLISHKKQIETNLTKKRRRGIEILKEKIGSEKEFKLMDIYTQAGYDIHSGGRGSGFIFLRDKAIEMGFTIINKHPITLIWGKWEKPTKLSIPEITREKVNVFIRSKKPEEQFDVFDVLKAFNCSKESYQITYWYLDGFVKQNVIERYTTYIGNQKRVFYVRKFKEKVEKKEEPESPPCTTIEDLKNIFDHFRGGSFQAKSLTPFKMKDGEGFTERTAKSLIDWITKNIEYCEKNTGYLLKTQFASMGTIIHVIG